MTRGRSDDPRLNRLTAQGLAGRRPGTVEDVVGHLLGVQAQDERGFRLAIRSRTEGLVATDVDRALTERRSVVVTWLQRGTLHLVRSEDYWWLHPLTASRTVSRNRQRLTQLGLEDGEVERGVETIMATLASEGPRTRHQLGDRLDAAGVPTAGQALIHLLIAASLRGLVVRGPVMNGEHAYVSVTEWLGRPPPALDRVEALARLARRYLEGHGPATEHDLAKWAGITVGDARHGLDSLTAEVVDGPFGLTLRATPPASGPFPPPRLLGSFDPLLHGWVSREPFVGRHAGVVTTNGIFRPVALAGGRVVAVWALPGGVVTIEPLEGLSGPVRRGLEEDAADVARYLGLEPRPMVVRRSSGRGG